VLELLARIWRQPVPTGLKCAAGAAEPRPNRVSARIGWWPVTWT
jgi:hypothetical protein